MTSSTRGVLIAGGTAVVVLIAGLVFVFHAGQAPEAKPVAAVELPTDDSALSLEERRQARLAQSQAMLGGKKFPSEATVPLPPAAEPTPPPPPSPPPPAAAVAPARPTTKPVVEPLPTAPEHPCVWSGGNSPVAEACRKGGQPAAKQAMKRLVAAARDHGARFTCDSCHVDQDKYTLREDARAEFMTLLENAKEQPRK